MEKIIQKIIDIEQMAQNVIEREKKEQEALEQAMGHQIEARKKEIDAKIQEKHNKIMKLEQEMADKRIAEIKDKAEKNQIQLDEIYKNNKSKWVDQIFNNIVNQ